MKILYLLCILLLSGCMHVKKENALPTTVWESQVLSTTPNYRMDTIETANDFIYAKQFLVYADSVLVVANKKHIDGYFIELYHLKTKKEIARLFRLGDGPQEMLSAIVYLSGKQLLVNDYVKGQLAVVHLDSLLRDSTYTVLPKPHNVIGSPTAVPYKEGFLLENPSCFADDAADIRQEAPRFIATDGKSVYTEKNRYKYWTRNVSVDGCIIAHPQQTRIVYASMHQSVLEIYDAGLHLQRLIKGPVDLHAKYSLTGEADRMMNVSFKEFIPYAYMTYYADENSVYLSYVGACLTSEMEMKDLSGWILKLDWEGNLIDCIRMESYVLSISKGKDGIYVTVSNSDETPVLMKVYENMD